MTNQNRDGYRIGFLKAGLWKNTAGTRPCGPLLLDNPKKTDKIRKFTPLTLLHQRGGWVESEKFYESGRRI